MSTTTTTRTRSRHETASRFLAALAGSAGGGERLELRYRLEDGQRMGQVFDRPTRLRGLATRAVALGRRTDVTSAARPGRVGMAAATPSSAPSCCGLIATASTPSPRWRTSSPRRRS
jgi:hypothetical protein